jgi:hypothetical protein
MFVDLEAVTFKTGLIERRHATTIDITHQRYKEVDATVTGSHVSDRDGKRGLEVVNGGVHVTNDRMS